MLLVYIAIWRTLGERDPAKGRQPSTLGPVNGGVVHNVALLGYLHMNFELNCSSRDSLSELVE